MLAVADERARPFTLDADARAEARIAADIHAAARAVVDAVGAQLRALLLVGSYGRGEGGVIFRDGTPGPDNDYDFVALVDGDVDHRLRASLLALGHHLSAFVGVEVTVWPFPFAALGRVPPTLFWLDATLGARVVAGDTAVLARLPRLTARSVPLSECGRLLANRAAGLALSRAEGVAAHPERAIRHVHKAVLACGDALLLGADRYRPSLVERRRELERLRGAPRVGDALVAAYAEALAYRGGRAAAPADVPAWFDARAHEVARWHLALEHWRCGAPLVAHEWLRWRGRVFATLPDVRTGGAVAASLRATLRARLPLWPFVGHPRERLARVAVALAYAWSHPRAEAARWAPHLAALVAHGG